MTVAENIINAYRSRAASSNWSEWSHSNKKAAEILADIEKDLQEKNAGTN